MPLCPHDPLRPARLESCAMSTSFLQKHRLTLQTVAFLGMIVLPFLLYAAAQVQAVSLLAPLIGLMAILMLAVILIG